MRVLQRRDWRISVLVVTIKVDIVLWMILKNMNVGCQPIILPTQQVQEVGYLIRERIASYLMVALVQPLHQIRDTNL